MERSLEERLYCWSGDPVAADAQELMDEAGSYIEHMEKVVALLQSQIDDLERQLEEKMKVGFIGSEN